MGCADSAKTLKHRSGCSPYALVPRKSRCGLPIRLRCLQYAVDGSQSAEFSSPVALNRGKAPVAQWQFDNWRVRFGLKFDRENQGSRQR